MSRVDDTYTRTYNKTKNPFKVIFDIKSIYEIEVVNNNEYIKECFGYKLVRENNYKIS